MKITRHYIFTRFLMGCSLLFLLSVTASAADTVASGICGVKGNRGDLIWALDIDGVLTISGSGEMEDYYPYWSNAWDAKKAPWIEKRINIKAVEISDGVTSIGEYAFCGCNSLTSVTISNSVVTIGENAFKECTSLADITIPNAVDVIANSTFSDCSNLMNITLPESVRLIGSAAFSNCENLTSITLPESITSIDNAAFSGCSSLTSIMLPEGITSINYAVFSGCSSLMSIAIPDGAWNIGNNAFKDCTNLTSIIIPDSVTSIGYSALEGCTSLTSITIPSEVISIKSSTFSGCSSLTDIIIPENVKTISDSAFCCCTNLTSITIPDKVTSIGDEAFKGCTSLMSIAIPSGVTSIGSYAFYDCSSLTSIAIPKCVTNIGVFAFFGCKGLSAVIFDKDSEVTQISDYAFSGCSNLTSIVIPDGVRDIGNNTFKDCINLTSITIPSEVISIKSSTFSGCSSLADIIIPENVKNISDSAFYCCTNLASITIPNKVTSIGDKAFKGCTSLTSITIPNGVTSIGKEAFDGCRSLVSVILPDGVTSISSYAFYDCSSLTSIAIPKCVTNIGKFAFFGCKSLSAVIFDKDSEVTQISDYAFSGCSNLTEIVIPKSVTSIGKGSFSPWRFDTSACEALSSVIFEGDSTLLSIGNDAFKDCSGLSNITFPQGVISIGDSAFNGCSNLLNAEFLGNAPTDFGISVFPKSNAGRFVINYHSGRTGWTTPMWNGYYTACVDEVIGPLNLLDDDGRNVQGILFTLNDESNTATVGTNTKDNNNAGYFGNDNGTVNIPDTVSKAGRIYRVIGIGQYAFSGNLLIKTIRIGSNISSIDPTAFLNCANFTTFDIAEDSKYYSAEDGVLFDAMKVCLYRYPCGKSETAYAIPASTRTVGKYAFADSKNLIEITVPRNVISIGSRAFSKCNELQSITLPFIGRSESGNETIKSVFDDSSSMPLPKSLERITITGGKLKESSFKGCQYLKEVTLPIQDTEIPYRCFDGCINLTTFFFADVVRAPDKQEICNIIPDTITKIGAYAFDGCNSLANVKLLGVQTIADGAFRGCRSLTTVEIPASVDNIGSGVFSDCKNITAFAVEKNNRNYYSDNWGVLYSKDLSTLICYPSMRRWPYYNVSEQTVRISANAFSSCANLVNLYIPKTATTLENGCIASCPGLTVCAYIDSAAYTYSESYDLTVWPMDNYILQDIEIVSLPEKAAFQMGQEDFSGLYVAVNAGKMLQLDDYTITYNANQSGWQLVTISYGGRYATFPIQLLSESDHLIDFGEQEMASGVSAFASVYDVMGKMLVLQPIIISNGKIQTAVTNDVYSQMGEVKLFFVDSKSFVPTADAVIWKK